MTEEWRAIPDHETHYEVSSDGRIRSLARVCHLYGGRSRPVHEKILTTYIDPHGGGKRTLVRLSKDGRQTTVDVGVLVMRVFA